MDSRCLVEVLRVDDVVPRIVLTGGGGEADNDELGREPATAHRNHHSLISSQFGTPNLEIALHRAALESCRNDSL